MHIKTMNWMQVEAYLAADNRCVLPLGCTEQHAYLSLFTDSLLAEKVALDAAEPLGIPVFPVVPYGITPYFRAFPGTISLRVETYLRVVRDVLDGMAEQGFRRILIVNGHGGNSPAAMLAIEWMADHPECSVKFHNWWSAPRTWAQVMALDPIASHASWIENFPWTRLPNVDMPATQKPPVDTEKLRTLNPRATRDLLGDGNYAGFYQRPDADTDQLWVTAIDETRALLTDGW